MTLVKTAIRSEIISFIKGNTKTDTDEAINEFADKLADTIINAIKSGTVTIQPGIIVQVTPVTGTGVTTSTGVGSIS